MFKSVLFSGFLTATILPTAASAQPICGQSSPSVGSSIGSAVGGTAGAIIGAIGDAVTGSNGSTQVNCVPYDQRRQDAYGYYDQYGVWHVGVANRAPATGYYDRNGNWV